MEVSTQAQVIAGRYALESLIGEGGMASVWRAQDQTLERAVAVKLLFARDDRDKQRLVQQFVREARIAASVHHRNVIHIVDFGTTDEQQPFMVMELLEGETLGQRLHREPRLTMPEIVQVAALTLRGLAAVHDAGIIHRDLKPENVFLTHDGAGGLFPKILDFGISRSIEPRSGRRSALTTREGVIVGTPEYMSPEQARGVQNIDKRADIYSVGAILYEAMTGKLAFASENVGDLIIQIVTGTASPVKELNPDVPTALSDVVAKAMARQPQDRFPDALSMQQALLAAAHTYLDGRSLLTLSDQPPLPSPALAAPRHSGEQPRTLQFPIEPIEQAPRVESNAKPRSKPVQEPARSTGSYLAAFKRRPLAFLALALALGFSAALLLSRAANAPSPIHARAEIRTALAAEAPVEPTTITVSLRNVPKDARVFVDDTPVTGDTLELPRDGRNRALKVVAPGKVPWQAIHHASSDASYEVSLLASEKPATIAHATRSLDSSHTSTAAPKKAHKKPPSALRRLDF